MVTKTLTVLISGKEFGSKILSKFPHLNKKTVNPFVSGNNSSTGTL